MKKDLKEKFNIDVPEIPAEIMENYNIYKEVSNGIPRYAIGWENHKLLSGINKKKLNDLWESYIKPIKDNYFAAEEKLPKAEKSTWETNPIVSGKTNEEQAELFEMRENPYAADDKYKMQLYYNGKPFGDNKDYSNSGAERELREIKELVKNAGAEPKAQAEYFYNKLNSNRDDVAYDWSIDRSVKNLGEEKLKGIIKDVKTKDVFMKDLLNVIEKEQKTPDYIERQVRTHIYNEMLKEKAQMYLDRLTNANNNINAVDIPVDPKDMEQAESIIGRQVRDILDPAYTWSKTNARQTLKDKIERRVRNDPGLARAMLVYIKQKQEETGKTVFTPKNEIWRHLEKLNENAENAMMNGTAETNRDTNVTSWQGDDITGVEEDKEWGRYKVYFTGKPDAGTRTLLKQNGFRWAPSAGAWVVYNTANGEAALNRVAEKLGWKKGE